MWVVVFCLLLLGCGPVLLGEEARALDHETDSDMGSAGDPNLEHDAATALGGSGDPDAGSPPAVVVRIKSVDCGQCFELQAEGSGGQPPYGFEWENGASGALRTVCVGDAELALTVVAVDAKASRSAPQTIQLAGSGADSGCQQVVAPPDAGPAPQLCVQNPSFEGTAAINTGQEPFGAPPWNACTNPLADNTPDVGNESVAVTPGVPMPVDGDTYLALGEGEQVSQALCSDVAAGAALSLELDASRVDVGGGVVPETEQVFLEIWGGLSADCSQHERLWMSGALQTGWQRFCVTLRPKMFTTQLTLRATADLTSVSPAYLLVDNLNPVDSCP